MKAHLEKALKAFDCANIADTLVKNGVPCGAVRTGKQAAEDPHTIHRGMVVDVNAHRGTGSPLKPSHRPVSYRRCAPYFSEHTDEIIREIGKDFAAYSDVLPEKK